MKKAMKNFRLGAGLVVIAVAAIFILNKDARAKGLQHYVLKAYGYSLHAEHIAKTAWHGERPR